MSKICLNCGEKMKCLLSEHCWCFSFPKILIPSPDQKCLCSSCLKDKVITRCDELIAKGEYGYIKSLGLPDNPQEGIDFYYNDAALLVMTKWYHLRRGFCCENDCKHCGYTADV